jgi:hypothetical protein
MSGRKIYRRKCVVVTCLRRLSGENDKDPENLVRIAAVTADNRTKNLLDASQRCYYAGQLV